METISIDPVIEISHGLGWMWAVFSERTFDTLWKNDNGKAMSKFSVHLENIEKDINHHFPIDKKKTFKKAADDFINAYTKYQESNFISKNFNYSSLMTKREIFYTALNDLIGAQNG